MGKFAIACPQCNSYVTAYNGLRGLIQNKITCGECGCEIDVKAERMTSVRCPSCSNVVVYDQGKKTPVCPVCKNEIAPTTGGKILKFKCPECGISLSAAEGTSSYECPICDHQIDVVRVMEKERYSKENLVSLIKYEGDNNTIVWKHPIEDFNTGSQLIVHESQEAVFFRDGQALDLFGSGRYTLETQSLPLMDEIYKLPTGDTRATFHSEVYFINLATLMNIKWGTDSRVRLFDPNSGMHISLGASGEFNIRVVDSRRILLKLVGTTEGFDIGDGVKTFRTLIMTRVKSNLAKAVKKEQINILEIDERLDDLSAALRDAINEDLKEYGLMMPEFFVVHISTPEDDETDPSHNDYMRMKKLYADKYLGTQQQQVEKEVALAARETKMVEAQTAADLELIKAQVEASKVKLEAQAKAEGYRMQAEAEAQEMKMKGYTYQQETSRQVGLEAMQNGITGGEGGSGGSGLGDLASLGISLGAMGSVIGMTRDAIQPITEGATQMGQSFGGQITGNQTAAGSQPQTQPQPEPQKADGWTCPECGTQNIISKFCPECGFKRPEPKKPVTWICPECGTKDITSKFCPECGCKRPEVQKPATWTCPECGTTDITSKFCPECGHKREE